MPEEVAAIDWLLLTALPLEHHAVLTHLPPGESITIGGRTGLQMTVGSARVVAVCIERMGAVAAGTAAADAIGRLAPRNVVLVGIAGGVRKDGERYLGDVLVAEQVVEYDLGKDTPEGFERRFEVFRPAYSLLRQARRVAEGNWQKHISALRPDGTTGRVVPHAQFGVIASGNQVVTNPSLVAELQGHWRQLVGLEMEAHAVARAAYEAHGPTGFLFVKGICDWADPQKADDWQPYAAAVAAAFVRALLGTSEVQASPPPPIQTERVDSAGHGAKQILRGFQGHRYQNHRLTLRISGSSGSRIVCLVAGRELRLGRERGNDVVLRAWPRSDENDARTVKISQWHSLIQLGEREATWSDLKVNYPTHINGQPLRSNQPYTLQQGQRVAVASAVTLSVALRFGEVPESLDPYLRVEGIPVNSTLLEPAAVQSVRLRREDNLAGEEEYHLLARGLTIGTDESCALQVSGRAVAGIHAQILWLNGSFWLEPLQDVQATRAGSVRVDLDRLVPLTPGLKLELGDSSVVVAEYGQRYLGY